MTMMGSTPATIQEVQGGDDNARVGRYPLCAHTLNEWSYSGKNVESVTRPSTSLHSQSEMVSDGVHAFKSDGFDP